MATRERTRTEQLIDLVKRWRDYRSSELAGAQSFLHHLLECYSALDYQPGEIFEQHPVRVQDGPVQASLLLEPASAAASPLTAQRMDMYIPRICVWEMKGPDESLAKHYPQVRKYWERMRPRYMVLCNFHEFWIYDTDLTVEHAGTDGLTTPYVLPLADLPGNPEALAFLGGERSYFAQRAAQVTRDAATYIGGVVRQLIRESRDPARDRERITKFALECVFAMFAEDTGVIPGKLFEQALKRAQESGDLSPVYTLFDDFGRADEFDRSNPQAPYINGPLFDRAHPKLPVDKTLLASLYNASGFDWTYVRPEIFGSIFEQALDPAERHTLGAHFTAEDDIMKVVGPTIVRPWRERIAACKTHKDCEALIERLRHYHVLDPACGSGNFLYIAYRELKLLERALAVKWEELYNHKVAKRAKDRRSAPPGPYFTVQQLHGIDKEEVAVQLTKVVLWIGQHMAARETDSGEPVLPLRDLSGNILKADALFTDWFRPEYDGVSELAIVGNPPFMGRHKMRLEMGDDYVDELHQAFPKNRDGDYVTYWYPKAIATLRVGERCGFVSTNSICQNESREVSIDFILESSGTLIDCWKSYPWPGEANVFVSIVCWINSAFDGLILLDGQPTDIISSTLSNSPELNGAKSITRNIGLSNQGVLPAAIEFVVDEETKDRLITLDASSELIIKPYLIGRDLNTEPSQSPSRHIIDFNGYTKEQASKFKSTFRHVQENVYPVRMSSRLTATEKAKWWLFKRPAQVMRDSIQDLDRFVVTSRAASLMIMSFCKHPTLPDSKVMVIALDSYYHFGILQSAVHEYWAWARGSTLKGDLAYTNTTIFETFPFPLIPGGAGVAGGAGVSPANIDINGGRGDGGQDARPTGDARPTNSIYNPRVVPDTPEAKRVSAVAEELYTKRQAACRALNLGLTKLYNLIKSKRGKKDPQDESFDVLSNLTPEQQALIRELRRLHEELNAAVCACYGWPADTWRDENAVLTRLLALNQALTG